MNRIERTLYHICFLVGFVVLFMIGIPIIASIALTYSDWYGH